jgi:hypothetical protein
MPEKARAVSFAHSGGILAMGLLSFLFGCGEEEAPFRKKDGAWHYLESPIEGADAKSFEALSKHYAKDTNRVYHADTYRKGQEYYTIKHTRIRVIEGADPATFRYLKDEYARDRSSMYYEGTAFPVKEIETFELLEFGFARDRVSGYYRQRPIPGSDGSTFAVVDSSYSKDASKVFYSALEPRGQGPNPWTAPVRGARPDSFRILDFSHATDAAQVYYRGEPLTKEVGSFVVLKYGYSKTATRVYYDGKPVQGADAASFATLEESTDAADARDRNETFKHGRKAGAAAKKPE